MPNINVAIAGVGNCCSSLVQGISYYSRRNRAEIPLLREINGYKVSDVKIVLAFDTDRRKVGKDLSDAIFSVPNTCRKFATVKPTGVKVSSPDSMKNAQNKRESLSKLLRETATDVLVNLTPTGALDASHLFAEAAYLSGTAFLNATPTRLATHENWATRFAKSNTPIAGDDLMDQVGSTILHKTILSSLTRRRVKVLESYQLDIGGGAESKLALDKERYSIKRQIKTESVADSIPYKVPLTVGSSDYAEFLRNRRMSYFWIKGSYFGDSECRIDIRLDYEDAPSSGAQLIDIIRILRVAKDRGIGGPLESGVAFAFKNPPKTFTPESLEDELELFLKRERER